MGSTLDRENYIARVKEARVNAGLLQEDIAKSLGIDRPTYTNYESRRAMPQKYIAKFCEITRVSEKWLLTGEGELNSKEILTPAPTPDKIFYIIGEVQAGVWIESQQWHEDDWKPVGYANVNNYQNIYALKVRGESMNKEIQNGDHVYVCPLYDFPKDLNTGKLVIVERCLKQMDICELTIKELVVEDGKAQLWPRSNHPDFQEPLDITWPYTGKQMNEIETVEIKGIVVGKGRDYE